MLSTSRCDSLGSRMTGPLLTDSGYSLSTIGAITGSAAATAGVLGAFVGGAALVRVGHMRALLVFGTLQAIGLAGYLLVSERLLSRVAPVRLLGLCAAACGLCYGAWLCVSSLWASAILLVLVGACSAPLYPLAAAQAYAALPGRSGAVNAAGHLFTPLSAALPLFLGWLADTHGTGAALIVLLAEPIGLFLVAAYAVRRT